MNTKQVKMITINDVVIQVEKHRDYYLIKTNGKAPVKTSINLLEPIFRSIVANIACYELEYGFKGKETK